MQKLFNMERGTNQGVVSMPWWTYIQDGLRRNLDQVITYYRRFPIPVESSHFIIKLITALGIYRNSDFEQFFNSVSSRCLGTSMALQMTSSINRGILFNGIFYGPNVKEILVAVDDGFDIYEAKDNWQELCPIRVLSHPKSDLGLMVPNGVDYNAEEGLAVIAINLPMLALQYREFRLLEDSIAESTGESPRSIMQFVYAYPLTNMLRSHLDVALFNRLNNVLSDIPLATSRGKHPFYLTDFSDKLYQLNINQVEMLKSNHRKFDGVMKSIPLVTSANLQEMMVFPDCALTRQIIWALAAASLPMLSFLFKSSGDNPRIRNAKDVNHLVRSFELYKTDKALSVSLPLNLYFDAKNILDNIRA